MEIRKVPISLLNAAPYNPRKDLQPGDPEYQKIARSIEKYGCVEPIIWNEKTGNVIGGHQRLKVLAATGAVEVDVSVVQLSLEDEKALNLALNKISGQWDNEKLSAVLQDLSAGFDVEVTGFDQHEVDALVASFAESGHEYELPGSEPYINNFFDSGVQAKPKAEEPAAVPAPEAPAQDAEMHHSAAPAPNEVQAVQPGGKKTVIVPNLSEQDGIMEAKVFENDTDDVDDYGLPPHSIEAVVYGGLDSDIAQIIYKELGAGIQTTGQKVIEVITASGATKAIHFNRPHPVPVYVKVVGLSTSGDFPHDGVDQLRAAIVAYIGDNESGGVSIGETLYHQRLPAVLYKVPGVLDFDVLIGTDAENLQADNIPVDSRSKVVTDDGMVTIDA